MFDPWAEVGRHHDVVVFVRRLDEGVVGLTDGVSRIWLDSRLNQVERRCVLTHEWRHYLLGHSTCQPLAVELGVCQWVARKLISMDDLRRVMPWSSSLDEMAEELAVTPQTLRDRLVGLSAAENALVTSWEALAA